jgi:AraC-like DNA-binding protein
MAKLPPLPNLKLGRHLTRQIRVTPDVPLRKFRDAASVEASVREFKKNLEETLGVEREETERIIAMNAARVAAAAEKEERRRAASNTLSLDEKVFILEAYFSKNVGVKAISVELKRPSSTVTKFLQRYKSTVPLAKMHIAANAEVFARRVVKNANVTESLEVLDRVDALPKKSRGDGTGSPQFNIIVAMPGQQQSAGGAVINVPVPTQAAIEAARQIPERGDA